jgi:hypothetical protein
LLREAIFATLLIAVLVGTRSFALCCLLQRPFIFPAPKLPFALPSSQRNIGRLQRLVGLDLRGEIRPGGQNLCPQTAVTGALLGPIRLLDGRAVIARNRCGLGGSCLKRRFAAKWISETRYVCRE